MPPISTGYAEAGEQQGEHAKNTAPVLFEPFHVLMPTDVTWRLTRVNLDVLRSPIPLLIEGGDERTVSPSILSLIGRSVTPILTRSIPIPESLDI